MRVLIKRRSITSTFISLWKSRYGREKSDCLWRRRRVCWLENKTERLFVFLLVSLWLVIHGPRRCSESKNANVRCYSAPLIRLAFRFECALVRRFAFESLGRPRCRRGEWHGERKRVLKTASAGAPSAAGALSSEQKPTAFLLAADEIARRAETQTLYLYYLRERTLTHTDRSPGAALFNPKAPERGLARRAPSRSRTSILWRRGKKKKEKEWRPFLVGRTPTTAATNKHIHPFFEISRLLSEKVFTCALRLSHDARRVGRSFTSDKTTGKNSSSFCTNKIKIEEIGWVINYLRTIVCLFVMIGGL